MKLRARVSPRSVALLLSAASFAFLCAGPGASRLAAADAVYHVLLFRFKADAPAADVKGVLSDLNQLPSRIPGITGLQWGTNCSPENLSKGYTHGLVMTFESLEAREKYIPHPEHQAFATRFLSLVEERMVFGFSAAAPSEPAEPGRVHHLVFFKFKPSATKDRIDAVNAAFAALPTKISGLIGFRSGTENLGRMNQGFTHGYVLTFVNDRARNDYLIHPAHAEFGKLVGPVLDEPLVVDFTVVPSSGSLFVTDGLEPYAVYQRGPEGKADLRFSGVSLSDGPIEARLRAGRRTVPGFDWKVVGKSEQGTFRAVLEGVPAGGEYTVEVRRRDALGNVADHTEVANILVGDIWILAGQSNMEGVGDLIDVEAPSPLVHCYTMAHRWELAVEPLHWLIDSPDPVHSGGALEGTDEEGRRARRAKARESRTKGAGLGLPFAREMVLRTGVPVGLLAAAHGGTSMQQWDPAARDQGGASLYGSMYKQVQNAGGKVRGVLWYQGESDANPDAVPLFKDRLEGLVAALRKDLGDPSLPFYYVQIGRFVRGGGGAESWNRIQELQRLAEKDIPGSAMVSVIDLPLDDLIHVGTSGLKRTGRRLSRIAERELFGASGIQRGPRLSSIAVADGGRTLRVRYSDVNGGLQPVEKVEGFSLWKDGTELKLIYNACVDRAAPDTVVLKLQDSVPAGASLSYGAGLDPVCNLVDMQDMAAPVFGPLPIPMDARS